VKLYKLFGASAASIAAPTVTTAVPAQAACGPARAAAFRVAVPTINSSGSMESMQPFPTRQEIESWFAALLVGSHTRDEADRWAAQWFENTSLPDDDVVRWALGLLHGIDLPAGADGRFLHDDDQVRLWLTEFHDRCAGE
jgi:hypothetical protein